MQQQLEDLTEQNFGAWHVLCRAPSRKGTRWKCRCKCGKTREVFARNLKNGTSTKCPSCSVRERSTKHGHTNRRARDGRPAISREYQTWAAMVFRSGNVTARWLGDDGFINFFADMGKKPAPMRCYRLERKDKTKPFSKENCHWKWWRNKVDKTYIFQGEEYTVEELVFISGMKDSTLRNRLERGMKPADAINIPVTPTKRLLTAFGETKTFTAWLADPRCKVSSTALRARLIDGWTHERAISEECWNKIAAFGERKTAYAWARDPRAGKGISSKMISWRIKQGWKPEKAISRRADGLKKYEAFGVKKSMDQWMKDKRCKVDDKSVIYDRLRRGWDMERALDENTDHRVILEAFGEKKTYAGWASDPRCVVSADIIQVRVTRYKWNPEKAITGPLQPKIRKKTFTTASDLV